tara:strand:+ start:357 stop:1778 length:1422 start_codon:yes stop_codon:yes gene_type:complete
MASALDKVTNFMLPDLAGNNMANLLGIDTVRKARGRALLDAGLTGMALAGPRPATDNVNSAMIMKQMFDQGYNTYDNAINREMTQLQTNMALQENLQKKETFNSLIASDLLSNDEKAFALTLGPDKGSEFLADVYMKKLDQTNKEPQTKKVQLLDKEGNKLKNPDGSDMIRFVPTAEILANPDLYQNPTEYGTYGKNIRDFETALKRPLTQEEKTEYINLAMKFGNQGISITQNPDGSVTFVQGAGSGMEKGTKKDLEKEVMLGTKNFQAFNRLQELWRPEFSEIPTRFGIKWNAFKESLGDWNVFGDISEEDKQLMADYYAWEQQAWDVTNQYIKAITGAQMSEAEAKRILNALPDPRTFSGSPTEYQAKLQGVMKNARLSIIRSNLLLAKGISPYIDGEFRPEQFMILSSVEDTFNEIGNQMFTEMRNNPEYDSFTDQDLQKEVFRILESKIGTTRDTSQYDINYSDILQL